MEYSDTITLIKNKRGCYDFDTSKGCYYGMANNTRGCYNDCYAFRVAHRYGIDFSKTVLRNFKSRKHEQNIIKQINKIDMPFIRMGVSGDPSDNWQHTLDICLKISDNSQLYLFPEFNKPKHIVIATKHWNNLTNEQIKILSNLNVCVNTSVSALDKTPLLNNRLAQYNRLKKYCKSVLRIVSCDFNLMNEIGRKLHLIQQRLFENEYVLDTVFRVSHKNELVTSGVINIEKFKFLGSHCYVSKYNKNTYFGSCSRCPDMCGIILNN